MEALLYFFSEELTLIENPEAWFVAKKIIKWFLSACTACTGQHRIYLISASHSLRSTPALVPCWDRTSARSPGGHPWLQKSRELAAGCSHPNAQQAAGRELVSKLMHALGNKRRSQEFSRLSASSRGGKAPINNVSIVN